MHTHLFLNQVIPFLETASATATAIASEVRAAIPCGVVAFCAGLAVLRAMGHSSICATGRGRSQSPDSCPAEPLEEGGIHRHKAWPTCGLRSGNVLGIALRRALFPTASENGERVRERLRKVAILCHEPGRSGRSGVGHLETPAAPGLPVIGLPAEARWAASKHAQGVSRPSAGGHNKRWCGRKSKSGESRGLRRGFGDLNKNTTAVSAHCLEVRVRVVRTE